MVDGSGVGSIGTDQEEGHYEFDFDPNSISEC